MRFNELIAGVRGDIAVKVFGDEFEPMLKAANQIAGDPARVEGAPDVKVEQVDRAAVRSTSTSTRRDIARLGLSVADVQDVIGAAIGGREAGRGVRRRPAFPDRRPAAGAMRARTLEALETIPVPLPPDARAGHMRRPCCSKQVAKLHASRRVRTRSAARTASAASWCSANVRGRDIASVVDEAQAEDRGRGHAAARLLARLGRTVREPAGGAAAPDDRRAGLLLPDLPAALFARSARRATRCSCSARVPLALTGGVVALWLRGMPFSISAAVGFIALSGVAVLNGLVMLTFINS